MKQTRQGEILKLIHQYEIGTQEELAMRLQESGYAVTQATVSRDIRELKLTKVAGRGGKLRYAMLQQPDQEDAGRLVRVFRDTFVSMDTADNLLVIHTVSGMAMAAAAVLDEMHWGEIVGCIAGDNCIFCAIRSREAAQLVMDRLSKLLG